MTMFPQQPVIESPLCGTDNQWRDSPVNMNQSSNFPFSIITGSTIFRLVHDRLGDCIDVVGDAYTAHAEGRSVNPASFFLRFPDRSNARIIGLPSHLSDSHQISGIKWISSFPDNVRQGFPRASAVLILNNHDNGYPFACLEASIISASRTAALAVLAARHLIKGGNRKVRSLGIVGTGLIARYVYRFLIGTEWEIENVYLYDSIPAEAERFSKTVCDPARHAAKWIAPDLDSLLTRCDLIVFTTVAAQPHVHEPALFAHNPVILHISLRDLAPKILLGAHNVVDDIDHVMHADTSPHLTEKLTGNREFVTGTLADIMKGHRTVDHARPVIFSPFGLGVLDLALGKWLYDRAVAAGEQITVNNFFHDLDR
jgi:2,3-diaminopropionate biosynthesis protein SbnB